MLKYRLWQSMGKVGREENRFHAFNVELPEPDASRQPAGSVWDASHLSVSHRCRGCVSLHHNPLSSQPASKSYLDWNKCQIYRMTSAGSLRPLQPLPASALIWQPQHPYFPLSEQCQRASSCLSIFNYPVKLHYITCTKSHPSDSQKGVPALFSSTQLTFMKCLTFIPFFKFRLNNYCVLYRGSRNERIHFLELNRGDR